MMQFFLSKSVKFPYISSVNWIFSPNNFCNSIIILSWFLIIDLFGKCKLELFLFGLLVGIECPRITLCDLISILELENILIASSLLFVFKMLCWVLLYSLIFVNLFPLFVLISEFLFIGDIRIFLIKFLRFSLGLLINWLTFFTHLFLFRLIFWVEFFVPLRSCLLFKWFNFFSLLYDILLQFKSNEYKPRLELFFV